MQDLLLVALLPLAALAAVDVSPANLFSRASSGCSTSGAASCSSSASGSCCFEAPGGLLLQTQFWDTSGPGNDLPTNWTVHGLWPDNCDGTFSENCDPSRDYKNIGTLISNAGQTNLLDFMNKYWVDINGQNEQFWEHEWATHGTCYSTLEPSCLPSGSPTGTEAVDFFLTVQKLFLTLPTYTFLAQAGITPSSSKTFSLSTLTSAIKSAHGFVPALDCDSGAIDQISYYFHLKGSLIDGVFVPIDAPEAGSCPSSGIKYPPKTGSGGGGSSTTSSGGSSPTGTPGNVPAKSHLSALTSSGTTGGVLTAGTWSVQTPATFTATTSGSGFTLSTSKGACGVSSGQFECGSGVSASTFTAAASGSNTVLEWQGSSSFSADAVPSGSTQEAVFTGSSHAHTFSLVFTSA